MVELQVQAMDNQGAHYEPAVALPPIPDARNCDAVPFFQTEK